MNRITLTPSALEMTAFWLPSLPVPAVVGTAHRSGMAASNSPFTPPTPNFCCELAMKSAQSLV